MTWPDPPMATNDRAGSQAALARSAPTRRATTGPSTGPNAAVTTVAMAGSSAAVATRISSGLGIGSGQQVRARPEQFGYLFHRPDGVHHHPAAFGVGQPFGQVSQQEGRAFH